MSKGLEKVNAMSDQTTPCFKKHVQFIEDMQKKTISPKKVMPIKIKNMVEVISVFIWLMMILWVELTSVVIFVFLFVRKLFSMLLWVENSNPTTWDTFRLNLELSAN